MHPLVLYDVARLRHEDALRQAEAQRHVLAVRGSTGRPRRQVSLRLHRWLRRPVLRASLRGLS